MIFDVKRISISTQPVTVGGRAENGDERDHVWVVNRDEVVRPFVLLQMLEFVDDDIHGAVSQFLV
jgi:hypothetical protein